MSPAVTPFRRPSAKSSVADLRQDPERLRRLGELHAQREQIAQLARDAQVLLQRAAAADSEVATFNTALANGRLDEQRLSSFSASHATAGKCRDEARVISEELAALSQRLDRNKAAFDVLDTHLMGQAREKFHAAFCEAILQLVTACKTAEQASANVDRIWDEARQQFGMGGDPNRGLGEWWPAYGGLIRESLPFFRHDGHNPSDFERWLDALVREGFLSAEDAARFKVAA